MVQSSQTHLQIKSRANHAPLQIKSRANHACAQFAIRLVQLKEERAVESRFPHHGAVQAFIKCSQCRTCNLGFASQIKTIVVGAVQEYKCSYSDFTARQTSQAHLRTFKTGCAIHMFSLWKRSKVHERFSVRVSDFGFIHEDPADYRARLFVANRNRGSISHPTCLSALAASPRRHD